MLVTLRLLPHVVILHALPDRAGAYLTGRDTTAAARALWTNQAAPVQQSAAISPYWPEWGGSFCRKLDSRAQSSCTLPHSKHTDLTGKPEYFSITVKRRVEGWGWNRQRDSLHGHKNLIIRLKISDIRLLKWWCKQHNVICTIVFWITAVIWLWEIRLTQLAFTNVVCEERRAPVCSLLLSSMSYHTANA